MQNQDGLVFTKIFPQTSYPAPLPATANETAFRGRNHNEPDCEGFLDFHLRDRRQGATPQELEVNPAPPTADAEISSRSCGNEETKGLDFEYEIKRRAKVCATVFMFYEQKVNGR